ncbi:MAG: hypothetical protein AAF696_05520 [Bacteroidota bacterium]
MKLLFTAITHTRAELRHPAVEVISMSVKIELDKEASKYSCFRRESYTRQTSNA